MNLHRFEYADPRRPATLEEERQRTCTAEAVRILRKARAIVERGELSPRPALFAAWDQRDPYGAIAFASVALDRALATGQGLPLPSIDRAIAELESEARR